MTYTFQKTVYVDRLELEIKANSSLLPKYSHIIGSPGQTNIVTTNALTTEEADALNLIVTNHVAQPTTAQYLKSYLANDIFPFVDDLMSTFAAENIAMGITQAGKTGAVLGLFVKQYDVNTNSLPISLKDTFDTGSLYESIKVIQHIRDNPNEYIGLEPFITDARLHQMKNNIETKLGVPLT